MMKGVDHLVLAGNNLDAMRDLYSDLGFTLTAKAQHPFGTGNTAIQLHGSYLELLAVTQPENVVEALKGHFSFSAFNRDYLARHEGFAMLVLGTQDASADIEAWRDEGLRTYAPFDFSRMASLPEGSEKRIGFSLAYTSSDDAPWIGHFACQHHAPEYFAQARYMTHENTARAVHDVWISGEGALGLADHMSVFIGGKGIRETPGLITYDTPKGKIVLSDADAFEAAFGVAPPHPGDGPHLAGLTIACETLEPLSGKGLAQTGNRLVLPPQRAFGTALAFTASG